MAFFLPLPQTDGAFKLSLAIHYVYQAPLFFNLMLPWKGNPDVGLKTFL